MTPVGETWRPLRLLMSYHYIKNRDMRAFFKPFQHMPEFFADSGAFTANTKGTPINIDEYIEWLKEYEELFALYATLDVIGDADASWKNYEYMRDKGLSPLPAFHTGEDMSYLGRYIESGANYVALGGMVGAGAQRLMPWLVACFKEARRYREKGYEIEFHGFGLTNLDALSSLPWFTVDSSSWGQPYRYGTLRLFDRVSARWVSAQLFDRKDMQKVAPEIQRSGFDFSVFVDRAKYHHAHAAMLSALNWRVFENHLRRRWGPMPCGKHAPGLHIYLADGSQDCARYASYALAEDPDAKQIIFDEVRKAA